MMFVSYRYTNFNNVYRILNLDTLKILTTCDVKCLNKIYGEWHHKSEQKSPRNPSIILQMKHTDNADESINSVI